ncbi:phage tail protein [Lacinutrix jangbogonensis]|uniref:phage tail protein n=1 Tax=Lacinutrix jangbogonensis TaxID=1469557 RepID=UPI00053D4577
MEPFIGEVSLFGGNFAPRGWAFCDGRLLAISSNSALFSILGTTYGGDGRTTFALPDLRGRSAIAPGTGPGLSTFRLGQRSGQENITLTVNNLPSHTHSISTQLPGFELDPKTTSGDEFTKGSSSFITVGNQSNAQISNSKGEASNTGNQQSFNIRNPYLAVNYIIALQGVFPSRS